MTRTFSLTIAGETREVEARDIWGDGTRFDSCAPVGAYQKRHGSKMWADRVIFWRQPDGSYKAGWSATILNTSGYRLVGWSDTLTTTSRHNSARKV